MIRQLGALAKITTGKLDANAAVDNGKYPFFTCNADPYHIDTYAFDDNAILISGNGSQVGHVNRYHGKFNAYQRTYVLTSFNSIDPTYLYHYLRLFLHDYISQSKRGSAVPYITMPMLYNFPVIIASNANEISKVADLIDSIVQADNYTVSLAKQFLDSIYNYWFIQFDFPDENGRPYKSSGGNMVYNEQLKQEIPVGWEAKKLLDLFSFERGTEVGSAQYSNYKVNDDYVKFYRVRDVGDDSSTWVSKENDLRIVKPGDVVITLDGTVGKIGIDIDGAISGGLRHAVDNSHKISNSMIWAILNSYYIQESLRRYVSGRGSILAHAGGAIDDLSIPYSEHIFKKFQNVTDPMFALMVNRQQESKILASLRDWLLPMLMNGQVKIKE